MFGGRTNYNINGIPNTLYMNASPSRVVYIPQNPNLNQNNEIRFIKIEIILVNLKIYNNK